jgi:outer membrane protein OmpA-like peptidoglycan-associated protein
MKKAIILILSAAVVISSLSCASMKRRDKGALIGAGTGAVIGGLIGKKAGNTAVGAILGAAVGGTAGAVIGNYMDKQAEEMQADLKDAKIERVGEGIKITFASAILFDVNKSDLRPEAQASVQKLATVLNKYPDTDVLIEGHTDSTGSHDHNMALSIQRAQAVQGLLTANSVTQDRLRVSGYGPDQPVASNSTDDGRQANRRVEIAIFANDKLKAAAEKQAGG